ncbi:hypothetical protein EJB05_29885 [Eragrostis curvula]|uniref:non-specific serine/threonine protein kinase n=1 Tax=Eragrostis curvula TaxID=38414 RepID=A0A5J9UV80_9POAL|nr:hypothetical protein EJB05_29885 [Eragrostis curvula]
MSGPRRCGGRRPERPAVVGDNSNGYVETDPTGRYGRFDELLGKGAMKSVYRGFDSERGVEVAWNQASLHDVLRSPDALQRMYSEVHLLSTLRHDAIIGFHASWVDVGRHGRNSSFNFITELFSSGTLRSYRHRYPRVGRRALPDAFYRLKDDDARRFIGRCLVVASKRPSAAELLHDPFLLDDDHHATSPSPRPLPADVPFISSNASDTTTTTTETSSSSLSDDHQEPDAARNDNMTITGKLNAEEDTVFLKVQIADAETGHILRNIYFPFDLASDTATEVAREMVKELDITDRDASEIAAMIEQEIDRLLPGREQHEYTYDDDENGDQPPPPFYYLSSSPTSSQGSSLCGVGPWSSGGFSSGQHGGGWSKDHYCYALSDDDDMSSMHSGKYSALHYDTSGHEEEAQIPEEEQVGARPSSSTSSSKNKTTRFSPGESSSSSRSPRRGADTAAHLPSNNKQSLAQQQLQRQCSMSPHAGRPRRRDGEDERRGRLSRNRSMVDMRSRLLHRTKSK